MLLIVARVYLGRRTVARRCERRWGGRIRRDGKGLEGGWKVTVSGDVVSCYALVFNTREHIDKTKGV